MSNSGDKPHFNIACFVQGDPVEDNFCVRVSLTMSISELVQEIIRVYNEQTFGRKLLQDNTRISLYQVDVSYREMAKIETPPRECVMYRIDEVQDYWPDPETIRRRHIQVLVRVETIAPIQAQPLLAGQDSMAQRFRSAPSASAAAHHSAFEEQQEKNNIPIYNGHPYGRTDIPIQLFHPAFKFFTAQLKNNSELAAERYSAAETFMFGSQALYGTGPARWSVIKGLLTRALGHTVVKDDISKCQSDGVVLFNERYSSRKAYGAVVEIKNEIGTGNSDPWIQGAQSYARYWSQLEMTGLRRATPCPSFIISIAGPWMCFSGAVYLDRVVVQPLTNYIWLGNHPQQDHHLAHVTRLFFAIDRTISFLKDYYTPLIQENADLQIEHHRDSPYIRSVITAAGTINFTYTRRMGDPNVIRPVFQAITEDGRQIVVKFAQFYNFEAHKLLEAQSLAPRLLSLCAEPVGGGLVMVVMELCGSSLDNYLDPTGSGLELSARTQVFGDVKAALDLLHANNLVFGDLRSPNVLVVETADGSLRGRLVDFEWCGIDGEARYPAGMNQSKNIGWAPGAEKGSLLRKEHDNHMLYNLFPKSLAEGLGCNELNVA